MEASSISKKSTNEHGENVQIESSGGKPQKSETKKDKVKN